VALADRLGFDVALAQPVVVEELLERVTDDQRRTLLRFRLFAGLYDV
jgi:hypothetical protein